LGSDVGNIRGLFRAWLLLISHAPTLTLVGTKVYSSR